MLLELAVGDALYAKSHYQGRTGYVLGHRPPIPSSIREELPYLAELIEKSWQAEPIMRDKFSAITRKLEKNVPKDPVQGAPDDRGAHE